MLPRCFSICVALIAVIFAVPGLEAQTTPTPTPGPAQQPGAAPGANAASAQTNAVAENPSAGLTMPGGPAQSAEPGVQNPAVSVAAQANPLNVVRPGTRGPSAGQSQGGLTVGTGMEPVITGGPAGFYYRQVNLVADQPGVAGVRNPTVVNPWGIAFEGANPFWLANNGSGVLTLQALNGQPFPSFANPKTISLPLPPGSPKEAVAAPTAIVFNDTPDFRISRGDRTAASRFIFVTEDGTISAWTPLVEGARAIMVVNNAATGADYKGAAIGFAHDPTLESNYLYVTNFASGTIDVFDRSFRPVRMIGGFTDPNLPPGYAPFGIRRIGSKLYVTYALQDADRHAHVPGLGNGLVNVFDTDGYLVRRFAGGGVLNAPYGLTRAPESGFGTYSGAMLVGNVGDGHINAFDQRTGALLGQLSDEQGMPVSIDGLWSLTFRELPGTGLARDPVFGTAQLFFTAGPNNRKHGLFGSLHARPANQLPPAAVPLRQPGGIASPITRAIAP